MQQRLNAEGSKGYDSDHWDLRKRPRLAPSGVRVGLSLSPGAVWRSTPPSGAPSREDAGQPMKRIPLEETELYRLLAPARIARIRPHLKRQAFGEGDYIYFDSQPAKFLWTVRSGEVRTLKGNACGRLTTLDASIRQA